MDPQNTKFQPRGEGGPPGQGGRRPVGAQAGATTGQLHFVHVLRPLHGLLTFGRPGAVNSFGSTPGTRF